MTKCAHPDEVWVVLHGYGQTASQFISAFDTIANDRRLVVAPEGLSRFYTRKSDGGVGSSWMTKHDRLNEIRDYVAYLDTVGQWIERKYGIDKLAVLGFSQGAATAYRWAAMGSTNLTYLIAWAGGFPPDLQLADLNGLRGVVQVVGTNDRLVRLETMQEEFKKFESASIAAQLHTFDGAHEINNALLKVLADEILERPRD